MAETIIQCGENWPGICT